MRGKRNAKPVKQRGEKKSTSTANKSKLKSAAVYDGKRPPSPAITKASSAKKSQTKEDREEPPKATSGKVGSAFGAVFRRVAPGNKTSKGKNEADAEQGAKPGPASLSKKVTRGAPAGKPTEGKLPRSAKRGVTNVDKRSMSQNSPATKDVTRNLVKGGVKGRNQKKPESKSKKGRKCEDTEVIDEASWLEDIVGHWKHGKEGQPLMADLEDQRLGELDDRPPRIGTTKRRLEAAFDSTQDEAYFQPVSEFGLGTLTNSVSFALSVEEMDREDIDTVAAAASALDIISGDSDPLWTVGMTNEYGSKGGTAGNQGWTEIVKAADILSRYYFDGNQEEEESLGEHTFAKVRSALSTFKDHAARLNVTEKALFAAVRDDPSVLESTRTFDDDDGGMSGIWSHIGRPLDKYIESYAKAFEAVFKRNKKDPGTRKKAMRLGSDRVSSRSVTNE